jgi:hypothetical protein
MLLFEATKTLKERETIGPRTGPNYIFVLKMLWVIYGLADLG